jgi:hypothetical protein
MHPSRAYKIEQVCKDLGEFSSKVSSQLPELKQAIHSCKPQLDCYVKESAGSVSGLRTELAVAQYRIKELENKLLYLRLCVDERSSREYAHVSTQTPPELASTDRLRHLEFSTT